MRVSLIFVLCLFLVTLSFAAEKPNIVIVLADDMGWGDPQCYQSDSKTPTPSIDRLAKEGIRFTDAHTPSSVCTPTRYTLLTGRYAWRTRLKSGVLDGFSPPLIADGEDTLASLLKRAGYQTHCIGKWHLGMEWTLKDGTVMPDRPEGVRFRQGLDVDFTKPFRGGPIERGFDTYWGISASLDMSPYLYLKGDQATDVPTIETEENRDGMFMNQVAGVTTEEFRLEDVLPSIADETARVIHESVKKDEPFFCYVPLTSPHLPVVLTEDMKGKSDAGEYGDFVVATDAALGTILKALDETGVADNTLVLYTSDNGGLFHWWDFRAADDGGKAPVSKRGEHNREFAHQSNADWRGTKADIWEGGHRVPFLIRWPEKAAGGQVCDSLVELTDMYATIAEIVGEEEKGTSGMDSFSMLPILTGEISARTRPFAVHHSVHGMFAVRKDDWKMIEGRGSGGFTKPNRFKETEPAGQLYNLENDPQETTSHYAEKTDLVSGMQDLLDTIRDSSATEVFRNQ
ncbi:MAG: hypothetical protein CMO55_21175 [Verrucomicrobiales bacterium]|nr:hypothetical protein [Verrucomicrobiales bacterium]